MYRMAHSKIFKKEPNESVIQGHFQQWNVHSRFIRLARLTFVPSHIVSTPTAGAGAILRAYQKMSSTWPFPTLTSYGTAGVQSRPQCQTMTFLCGRIIGDPQNTGVREI
jgi:hypothetical protein